MRAYLILKSDARQTILHSSEGGSIMSIRLFLLITSSSNQRALWDAYICADDHRHIRSIFHV